jgi:hypothetical protein
MGAYKQFLASDIVVTPFEVNKAFTFEGAAALTASVVSIDRFLGTNLSGLFHPTTDPTTGQVSTQYQRLIYNSVKQLYYSNYLSSSYGDQANVGYIVPGNNEAGNVLVGSTSSTGRYFDYNQTDLTFPKYFPTASGSTIGVLSIPSRLFGNYIQPNSFRYITAQSTASIEVATVILNIAQLFATNGSTSGSININGVEFYATSSLTLPSNEPSSNPPRIYFYIANGQPTSTTRTNLINAITASLNFSSSISPYDTYLSDITASISGTSLLLQAKTPGVAGNAYYITGLIPPTPTTYFTNGFDTRTITDDGEGNLVSGSNIYGNIFYYHGMAILTSGSSSDILNFVTSSAVTCSFSSSLTIYETQYKCTIRSSEFNVTLNPTAEVSGSLLSYSGSYFYQPKGGVPTDNTTGSYFAPYVTTVGLYDEDQNLLAIGKLAQPLPTSATTDTTILVNIDR